MTGVVLNRTPRTDQQVAEEQTEDCAGGHPQEPAGAVRELRVQRVEGDVVRFEYHQLGAELVDTGAHGALGDARSRRTVQVVLE